MYLMKYIRVFAKNQLLKVFSVLLRLHKKLFCKIVISKKKKLS